MSVMPERATSVEVGAKTARPEREIQKAILEYLKLVPGVYAFRMNTGAMFGEHKGKRWAVRFGKPGVSDIIGWRSECLTHHADGPTGFTECPWPHPEHVRVARWLAIEVKVPGKRPSGPQAAFLESVRKAGGIALVATSVADVQRVLPTPGMVRTSGAPAGATKSEET